MARESTIKIYRSDSVDKPTGLTFGEPAFVTTDTAGNRLYIGGTAGNSIWIAAGITDSFGKFTLNTSSDNHVVTQKGVADHVLINRTLVNGYTGSWTFSNNGGRVKVTATYNPPSGNFITINDAMPFASASITGVAKFNATYFTVESEGDVVLNTPYRATGSTLYSTQTITVVNGATGTALAVNPAAIQGIAGSFTLNGATAESSLTAQGGAIFLNQPLGQNNGPGPNMVIGVRIADNSLTGVAAFNSTYYSVSAAGVVSPTTPFQFTGDTVSTVVGSGITVTKNSSGAVVSNIGVTGFNGLTGNVSLTGYIGGAVRVVENDKVDIRIATSSVTGVAAFSTDNFAVSPQGVVTVKDSGIANAELVNSSITLKASAPDSGNSVSLGQSFTLTGVNNQILLVRDASTVTVGFADDVIIPGNLTVNGTVVTANVSSFTVEDPLIALGSGNANDTVDLGFYSIYNTSTTPVYTGLFRDQNDTGKYKLFTNLTEQPTTTVNTSAASYRQAELVARIDGGTF